MSQTVTILPFEIIALEELYGHLDNVNEEQKEDKNEH
jgi:hypothetical protein